MQGLADIGRRFVQDDFCTAFSYLQSLPVDYIKIDSCFIMNMAGDPMGETMIHSVMRSVER